MLKGVVVFGLAELAPIFKGFTTPTGQLGGDNLGTMGGQKFEHPPPLWWGIMTESAFSNVPSHK